MEKLVKKEVTKFLPNNYDVMAYNPAQIKSVNRDVIKHRLNVRKQGKVVKERNRNFALER